MNTTILKRWLFLPNVCSQYRPIRARYNFCMRGYLAPHLSAANYSVTWLSCLKLQILLRAEPYTRYHSIRVRLSKLLFS